MAATSAPRSRLPRGARAARERPSAGPSLKGLGPRSRQWLARLGIHDLTALQRADAVDLYLRLRRQVPGVSLNLLYALVGAQQDRDWRVVMREQRSALLAELDARRMAGVRHAPR